MLKHVFGHRYGKCAVKVSQSQRQHAPHKNAIFMFVYILTVSLVRGNTAITAERAVGVLKSVIVLPCERNETLDINIVEWKVNSSEELLLWYFPKEDEVRPPDRDPRLNIVNRSALAISTLQSSDSGIYECTTTSLTLELEKKSAVHLEVLDGCRIWEYAFPLTSEKEECSSGATIYYKQQCEFSCYLGFSLVGDTTTTCMKDGTLNNNKPRCEGSGLNCTIEVLPPYLSDENGLCQSGAVFQSERNCSFKCETGYILQGNQTVTLECLADGNYSANIPTCESNEEYVEHHYYLAPLAVIPICGMIAFGIYVFYKRKKLEGGDRKSDEEDHQRVTPNVEEMVFVDPCDVNRNEESDTLLPVVNSTTQEIQLNRDRDEADEVRGQYNFLRQQINFDRLVPILNILEHAEVNMVKYSPCEIGQENDFIVPIQTTKDAFAWYISIVIRCISAIDEVKGDTLFNDIISASTILDSERSSTESADTAININDSWDTTEDESADMYLNTIHEAFTPLLILGRQNLPEDEISDRTGKVFILIKTFLKGNSGHISDQGSSSRSRSTRSPVTIKGLKELQSGDPSVFFAQKCLDNIARCTTVKDAIKIRYIILKTLLRGFDETRNEKDEDTVTCHIGNESNTKCNVSS